MRIRSYAWHQARAGAGSRQGSRIEVLSGGGGSGGRGRSRCGCVVAEKVEAVISI